MTALRELRQSADLSQPLPAVPADYDIRLKNLRRRLGLTQAALAHRIGAANKAVGSPASARRRPCSGNVRRH
jgi:ribosome-binding protein aMBF1 (putative translation factor)